MPRSPLTLLVWLGSLLALVALPLEFQAPSAPQSIRARSELAGRYGLGPRAANASSLFDDSHATAAASPLFDEHRAMTIIHRLADGDLAGRKSGLASGARTEEYVAAQFRAAGLEPAGESGSYFQTIPMLATEEHGARMELLDSPYGPLSMIYGVDFALVTNSGSADLTAEVVAVGHGLCDETRAWDDYGEIDVQGKIVLIVRGAPDNGYDWDQETSRDSTLHEAVRRGAAGVLYLQEERPVHGGAVHAGSYFPEIPVAYIGHRAADLLFLHSGKERATYEREISSASAPRATGRRMHLDIDVEFLGGAFARNVVGAIGGSDPALRDEIIVIGGHMDHLGADARGLVFPGANDNASGSAVVMELARAFAASPLPPRRTIVFTTFAGEEQGLVGSEAFVEHPPIDLARAVAMINFDMAGHGDGTVGIGGGEFYPQIMHAFQATLDSTAAKNLIVARAWGGEGSDHAPFRRAGIATCNIWSEGDHHFYHTIEDEAAWIDSTVVGNVGRMAERWIRMLADWPAPLAEEHRSGRTLLAGAYQVDFDGLPAGRAPEGVSGAVRWFDPGQFASEEFLDTVGRLRSGGSDGDSVRLIDGLSEVRGAARDWKQAQMLGMEQRTARIPEVRLGLLQDLHVSMIRWPESTPPDEAREYLAALCREGVVSLIAPDTAWVSLLPSGGKALVRVFANRGEDIASPDRYPRERFYFIVSLDGPMAAADLAAILARCGWDRVHLDLVPWLVRAGQAPVQAFLEELQAAGPIENRHLRAMLGQNLEHMQ
ncbi:MAG: M28 family peptidase [Candidatus Eisenbacteria bacterium]